MTDDKKVHHRCRKCSSAIALMKNAIQADVERHLSPPKSHLKPVHKKVKAEVHDSESEETNEEHDGHMKRAEKTWCTRYEAYKTLAKASDNTVTETEPSPVHNHCEIL